MTSDEIDAMIVGIYMGHIDAYNLPVGLYKETYERFAQALIEGFGDIEGAKEQALIESLFKNVQIFSGAKTYHQVAEYQSYIYEDGNIIAFADFRKKVLEKYETYNKTWLATEYQYCTENARAAKRWVGIWDERTTFPLLEYVTVGDARVRPEHRRLDGVVRPVGDSFWNKYYPPWSWNCRCTTKSYESGEKQITEIMNKKEVVLPKIDKMFAFNSGKKGIIFSKFHPYFTEVPAAMKSWASHNFGLPILKRFNHGQKI